MAQRVELTYEIDRAVACPEHFDDAQRFLVASDRLCEIEAIGDRVLRLAATEP
jgi:hypothetical protein